MPVHELRHQLLYLANSDIILVAFTFMKISLNFLVRLAGMFGLGYLGFRIGIALSGEPPTEIEILATQLLTLAGTGLGLLTTHRWTVEPVRDLFRWRNCRRRSVSLRRSSLPGRWRISVP
jgi:hypothetical protein